MFRLCCLGHPLWGTAPALAGSGSKAREDVDCFVKGPALLVELRDDLYEIHGSGRRIA